MKIYLSSSWKNRERVRAMAIALRGREHSVYDFTDPESRGTPEIPPEAYPEQFDPEKHVYSKYIVSVPAWREAIECNRAALIACDLVVLLLPCGNDGHADWAFAVGRQKITVVVGAPKAGDRSPTHMWSDGILDRDDEVPDWIENGLGLPRGVEMTNEEKVAVLREARRCLIEEPENWCVGMDTGRQRLVSRISRCSSMDSNREVLEHLDSVAKDQFATSFLRSRLSPPDRDVLRPCAVVNDVLGRLSAVALCDFAIAELLS